MAGCRNLLLVGNRLLATSKVSLYLAVSDFLLKADCVTWKSLYAVHCLNSDWVAWWERNTDKNRKTMRHRSDDNLVYLMVEIATIPVLLHKQKTQKWYNAKGGLKWSMYAHFVAAATFWLKLCPDFSGMTTLLLGLRDVSCLSAKSEMASICRLINRVGLGGALGLASARRLDAEPPVGGMRSFGSLEVAPAE